MSRKLLIYLSDFLKNCWIRNSNSSFKWFQWHVKRLRGIFDLKLGNSLHCTFLFTFYSRHFLNNSTNSPVGCGCWIHWLHLWRGERSRNNVLDTRLNHLISKRQPWKFVKCEVVLYCHCFQVYFALKRKHLIGSYLWLK